MDDFEEIFSVEFQMFYRNKQAPFHIDQVYRKYLLNDRNIRTIENVSMEDFL